MKGGIGMQRMKVMRKSCKKMRKSSKKVRRKISMHDDNGTDEDNYDDDDITKVARELDAERIIKPPAAPCARHEGRRRPGLRMIDMRSCRDACCREGSGRGSGHAPPLRSSAKPDQNVTGSTAAGVDAGGKCNEAMLDTIANHVLNEMDIEFSGSINVRGEEATVEGEKQHMNLFEDTGYGEEDEELLAPMQGSNKERYVHVPAVVDSGASDHCINRAVAPEVPIRSSPGSRRGQVYSAAGGKGIHNEGEQELPLVTDDGLAAPLVFQVAEVRKPLCSVARLCDRGNRVIFGRGGGVVQNLHNGTCTRFKRQGSIYMLDFWLDSEAPFQRRG